MRTIVAFTAVICLSLAIGDTASAQTVVRPSFLFMVDNSGSMAATTGSGNNSCGYARTRINDVACVMRNMVDNVGDATFGFELFRTSCRTTATPYYRTDGRCATLCTADATSRPAAMAFPSYPYEEWGCVDDGRLAVPINESRRYEIRSWADGSWTSCTDVPAIGQLGGNDLVMGNGVAPVGGTPLAGYTRTALHYLSNRLAGTTSPYVAFDATGQPDPFAACRPVNLIALSDGAEDCGGGGGAWGQPLNAANIGCLQVDLNMNGMIENPIPNSEPNPLLRGKFESNRDFNGDGDCYDAGEQRAFRTRVYPIFFGSNCNSSTSVERTGELGGVGLHPVSCAANAMRYGYYATSEEEVAAAISQIVADSQLIETCNGLDDDCDGEIDEGFNLGAACSVGVGACARNGVLACSVDGGSSECSVSAGSPTSEASNAVCADGIDNDCDTFIDCGDPNCAATGPCTTTCVASTEICDGRDNDCDNLVDEGGITRPCGTSVGVCEPGTETCEQQTAPGSGTPTWSSCTGVGPGTETCNGLDDNCNVLVDEGLPIGPECGPSEGQCRRGNEQCVSGAIACVGGVPASLEICDCDDNDCDGMTDEPPDSGSLCPSGASCVQCQCALPCDTSAEFGELCPEGRLADSSSGTCFCISPPCDRDTCAASTQMAGDTVTCAPDNNSVAPCVCRADGCHAACDGRVCDSPTICNPRDPEGRCVENNCRGLGCDAGQICDPTGLTCIVDPCATVQCANDQACRNGLCEQSCGTVTCASNETCVAGTCVLDLCDGVLCVGTEFCNPESGTCVANRCFNIRCAQGQTCDRESGRCVDDPCLRVRCPSGQMCALGECRSLTPPPPPSNEQRLAVAGGCRCTVSKQSDGVALYVGFFLVLVGLWLRRARLARPSESRMLRLLRSLGITFMTLVTCGCALDPFCLNCETGDAATSVDAAVEAPGADALAEVGDTSLVCRTGTSELCNNFDDDCDGQVDEGVDLSTLENCGACGRRCSPPGAFGQCVTGECQIRGCDVGRLDLNNDPADGCEYTCLQTRIDDSVCNLVDDDCDGTVDEDVLVATDETNCGRCGNVCAYSNGVGLCEGGICSLSDCVAGFYNLNGSLADGCEYQCTPTSVSEVCNGLDDNCDGTVDEGVAPPPNFCRTMGPCSGAAAVCMGAVGFRCSYAASVEVDPSTGQPVVLETRCDGTDGNCNGSIDETFALGGSCANGGVGSCGAVGTVICSIDGTATRCSAPPVGTPGSETCNGLDDDCDGSVDETRASPGTSASFVNTNWISYAPNRWMMQFEASRPGATDLSQGSASNRACSAPGVLPWTNLRYQDAVNACAAAGATLCAEADWETACRGSGGACTYAWQSPSCTSYSADSCNTADRAGSDVLRSTGSLPMCHASVSGSQIYDLSGNVKEMTLLRPSGFVGLRGGSYTNLGFAASCESDWTTVSTSYRFDNVGFRCCFDGPVPP